MLYHITGTTIIWYHLKQYPNSIVHWSNRFWKSVFSSVNIFYDLIKHGQNVMKICNMQTNILLFIFPVLFKIKMLFEVCNKIALCFSCFSAVFFLFFIIVVVFVFWWYNSTYYRILKLIRKQYDWYALLAIKFIIIKKKISWIE